MGIKVKVQKPYLTGSNNEVASSRNWFPSFFIRI